MIKQKPLEKAKADQIQKARDLLKKGIALWQVARITGLKVNQISQL